MTPYGATKLMGERIGKIYSERHCLSVICFRVGWVPRGENSPSPHMKDWFQRIWLSNRDFCQAVEQAILVQNVRFALLNLMSNNVGLQWDLAATRRVLGYEPQDSHVPQPVSLRQRLQAQLLPLARRLGLIGDVLSSAVLHRGRYRIGPNESRDRIIPEDRDNHERGTH